jgi:hypothetical protein
LGCPFGDFPVAEKSPHFVQPLAARSGPNELSAPLNVDLAMPLYIVNGIELPDEMQRGIDLF